MGALALIITVGGTFGFLEFLDVRNLRNNSQEVMVAQNSVLSVIRRPLIDRMLGDAIEILDAFNVNLVDRSLMERIDLNQQDVVQLLRSYPDSQDRDDQEHFRILNILSETNQNLLLINEVHSTNSLESRLRVLSRASQAWSVFQPSATFVSSRFQGFIDTLEGSRLNVLGVLQLSRYRAITDSAATPDPGTLLLDMAAEHFLEAIEVRSDFSRPHTNLGVIESYRFRELTDAPVDERLASLARSENHTRNAFSFLETAPGQRSVMFNNLANLDLLRAGLFLSSEPDRAEGYIRSAQNSLRTAVEMESPSGVVFITMAEAECLLLGLNGDEVDTWSPDQKRRKLQSILELVESALEHRFSGFDLFSGNELLARIPFFKHLSHLDREFHSELYQAAGIAS